MFRTLEMKCQCSYEKNIESLDQSFLFYEKPKINDDSLEEVLWVSMNLNPYTEIRQVLLNEG